MKTVRVLLFVLFFVAFLNIEWLDYRPGEQGVCQNLYDALNDIQTQHASSLFKANHYIKDESFRQRTKEAFLDLVDPYSVSLLDKTRDKFLEKSPESQFCKDFYELSKEVKNSHRKLFKIVDGLIENKIQPPVEKVTELEIKTLSKLDQRAFVELFLAQLSEENKKYEESFNDSVETTSRGLKREYQKILKKLEFDTQGYLLKAALSSIDPHSDYYMATNYLKKARWLKSSFLGVGIMVKEVFSGYKILDLVSGGPAERQGVLEKNDTIISASGVSLVDVDQQDLSSLLGGPKGSEVKLKVERRGKIKTVYAVRGEVRNNKSKVLSEIRNMGSRKLGRIYLSQFYVRQNGVAGVSEEFLSILQKFNRQGVDGLVVDLRGNLGGVLDEVIKIVGYFITHGPVVLEYATSTQGVKFYSDVDNISYFDKPVVVLTDKRSASASEILAGSLKSLNRGVLVGESQTFGKGTIQTISDAKNFFASNAFNGAVKLTTGFYYLPNGESVQEQGVSSHINIEEKSQKEDGTGVSDFLEKDYANVMATPKSIDVNLNNYKKWLNDKEFSDLVNYLQANYKIRGYLNKKKKGAKDKAFKVLADMVDYYSQQLLRVAESR